jgi:hypothetical protein
MNAVRALGPVLAALLLLLGGGARGEETIELIPDQRASWGATNLFAPITGWFLGGPGYWYSPRRIEVETTPPGAALDLYYVRSNFQKAYEQADAPVTIVLPSRVEATPRDSVTIRALLDGHRQEEVKVRVRSRQSRVLIELEPVANTLVALTHTYLAGRGSLDFLTEEALTFRTEKHGETYSVVFLETALSPEAREGIEEVASSLISSVKGLQLGEDLVVRLTLSEAARRVDLEIRFHQSFDPARSLHRFALNLVPGDGGAEAVRRARAALARITPRQVRGCALEFDTTLRQQLDPAALAQALEPKGAFTDPYLRAATRRLGEVSPGGVVTLTDGTTFRVSVPIELAAAASQTPEARGYLALLRQFVAELEPPANRRRTLRGLIAPELGSARFDTIMDRAEAGERRCLAGAS